MKLTTQEIQDAIVKQRAELAPRESKAILVYEIKRRKVAARVVLWCTKSATGDYMTYYVRFYDTRYGITASADILQYPDGFSHSKKGNWSIVTPVMSDMLRKIMRALYKAYGFRKKELNEYNLWD